jgi:lipopolysaccharide export system protein LptC
MAAREPDDRADKPSEPSPAATVLYRMRHWHINPRATLLGARRYSVFVKFMKGLLPLAALGLGVAVLAYALQPRENNRITLTFERLNEIEGDLAMVNPRLTGTDNSGYPFVVTATSAMQEGRGSDVVRLENVSADITLSDGTGLHVTAAKGVVDTKRYVLDVSGGIRLTSDDGYDARTDSAVADLKAGLVRGDKPIDATGKFGRISAQRFALNRDARQLRFSGNVRMLLNRVEAAPAPRNTE